MDYKKLNEILKDIHEIGYSNDFKKVDEQIVKDLSQMYDGEGSQGDSNEIYRVYDVGLEDGMFMKIEYGSDSYGYEEFVRSIQFVKATPKQVTVYEYTEE